MKLDDLVHQIIEEQGADREGRRIDFSVGKLGMAEADLALLKQALANLLGNAIKFTRHKNPAVIEVGCRHEPRQASIYYVRDNGAGFDMHYAQKLFGVFERLHAAEEYEGTGVGLAIVQRVIERHGGQIWAQAKLDQGATFYFTLQPGPRMAS